MASSIRIFNQQYVSSTETTLGTISDLNVNLSVKQKDILSAGSRMPIIVVTAWCLSEHYSRGGFEFGKPSYVTLIAKRNLDIFEVGDTIRASIDPGYLHLSNIASI